MTIKDIAKIAGVSHSTVSRALNDSPLIPAETRERIRAVANEYGYSPNTLARRLVNRKSRTLGLFFLSLGELNFMENFGTQFMTSITQTCHEHDYDLLLFTTPRDLTNTKSYMALCKERQVEGVIFIGMTSNDPHITEIRHASIPVSIIDYNLEGKNTACIGTDSKKGIRMALEWLSEQGHRDIAFIGGPEVSPVAMEREYAYREYLQTSPDTAPPRVFRGDFSRTSGFYQALEIMKSKPIPSAILTANDAMALGAMKALKEHGIRIPVDISIMGYDNAAAGDYADPALTTIGQKAHEIGKGAVLSILNRIEGHQSDKIHLIEPELILRNSVRKIPRDT